MMLKNFTDSQFVNQLVERFDKVFNDMNFITKLAFSKYHQFLADVQSFKTALLKFVLEAHLSGWMRIMESKGFKEASEEKQLAFIESRLSRISKDLLFEYLIQCKNLIKTSVDLHEEYGTTINMSCITWNKFKRFVIIFYELMTLSSMLENDYLLQTKKL